MVLVDTSVWSLALRRRERTLSSEEFIVVDAWRELANSGRAALLGIVRQEVLSGIRDASVFQQLRDKLNLMPHFPTEIKTHDLAATLFNRCRSEGFTASTVDILICASALSHRVPILAVDTDFERLAALIGVDLLSLPRCN